MTNRQMQSLEPGMGKATVPCQACHKYVDAVGPCKRCPRPRVGPARELRRADLVAHRELRPFLAARCLLWRILPGHSRRAGRRARSSTPLLVRVARLSLRSLRALPAQPQLLHPARKNQSLRRRLPMPNSLGMGQVATPRLT